MTTLDQAFIKAFSRQEVSFGPVLRQPPEPTLLQPTPPQPIAMAPAKHETAPARVSDIFRDVLATLDTVSGQNCPNGVIPKNIGQTRPCKVEKPARGESQADADAMKLQPVGEAKESPSESFVCDNQQSTIDFRQSFAAPFVFSSSIFDPYEVEPLCEEPICFQKSPCVEALPRIEKPPRVEPLPSTPSTEKPFRIVEEESSCAEECSDVACMAEPSDLSASPEFKPAWQVDRFTWPKVCRRLMARADDEFDRLADALLAANARGEKVLGIAGCSRGEGASTLLLCVARRLAERGVSLALVDADTSRPRLAKRLGVQPQLGWNQTSDEEGTLLDHAVIESVSNNLTLAGICEPESHDSHTGGDWSRLGPCLETLRNHFEMTLVDLGPLENIASLGDSLGRMAGGRIDAVLLIHNRRVTSDDRLAAVERELTTAGVALAGLIENFVAV